MSDSGQQSMIQPDILLDVLGNTAYNDCCRMLTSQGVAESSSETFPLALNVFTASAIQIGNDDPDASGKLAAAFSNFQKIYKLGSLVEPRAPLSVVGSSSTSSTPTPRRAGSAVSISSRDTSTCSGLGGGAGSKRIAETDITSRENKVKMALLIIKQKKE